MDLQGCDSQILTLFQDFADEIDIGVRIDAIVTDLHKALDVALHNILLTKLDKAGIDK